MNDKELIKCPLCNESFKDRRGLTSHARNIHDLEKEEVFEKMSQKEKERKEWKIIGGIGAVLLGILGLGRIR